MLAFQDYRAGEGQGRPPKEGLPSSARPQKSDEKKQNPSLVCVGIITSPHGIQGHVKVKSFLEDPASLLTYSPFYNEEGEESYRVTKIFSQTKDMVTVALDGISSRTAAESLRGANLMVLRTSLPGVTEDTFYHADLMGLQVLSETGESLGIVHAVYNFGAGDILEIQTSSQKLVMIPFSKEIVPGVDVKKGTLRVSQDGESLLRGDVS